LEKWFQLLEGGTLSAFTLGIIDSDSSVSYYKAGYFFFFVKPYSYVLPRVVGGKQTDRKKREMTDFTGFEQSRSAKAVTEDQLWHL
jgi:hypothetical protein